MIGAPMSISIGSRARSRVGEGVVVTTLPPVLSTADSTAGDRMCRGAAIFPHIDDVDDPKSGVGRRREGFFKSAIAVGPELGAGCELRRISLLRRWVNRIQASPHITDV